MEVSLGSKDIQSNAIDVKNDLCMSSPKSLNPSDDPLVWIIETSYLCLSSWWSAILKVALDTSMLLPSYFSYLMNSNDHFVDDSLGFCFSGAYCFSTIS